MHKFESTVNHVSLVAGPLGHFVKKQYGGIALGNGMNVPILRYEIERRLFEIFKKIHTPNSPQILVPRILNKDLGMPTLEIEYVSGSTLLELLKAKIPLEVNFFQLGSWLRFIEIELYSRRHEIFHNLWSVQEEIGQILARIKGAVNVSNAQGFEITLSLGDVGLTNLIWLSPSLYVIDFEFAHLCMAGRDVGQLCAQLDALGLANDYQNNLFNGYVFAGGNSMLLNLWKDKLSHYYEIKFYKGIKE